MDFASTVESLLANTESVIQVRHTTEVDASSLKQLLHNMARKIQLQDLELQRQQETIIQLAAEVRQLKAQNGDAREVRHEVSRVVSDTEALAAQQRMLAQRLDRLQTNVLDMNNAQFTTHASTFGHRSSNFAQHQTSQPTFTTDTPTQPSVPPRFASISQPPVAQKHVEVYTPPPPNVPLTPKDEASAKPASTAKPAKPDDDVGYFTPSAHEITPIGAPAATDRSLNGSTSAPHAKAMAGIELQERAAGGLLVTAVKPGGPAHIAGIVKGDVILRVNKQDMQRKSDFVQLVDKSVPGQGIDVTHQREGHAPLTTRIFLGTASSTHNSSSIASNTPSRTPNLRNR